MKNYWLDQNPESSYGEWEFAPTDLEGGIPIEYFYPGGLYAQYSEGLDETEDYPPWHT